MTLLLLTSKHISDTQSNCKPLTTPYIADFSIKLTTIQKPPTNEEKWFPQSNAGELEDCIHSSQSLYVKVIANFSHLIRRRP